MLIKEIEPNEDFMNNYYMIVCFQKDLNSFSYEYKNYNKECNYIEECFSDFLGFYNLNEQGKQLLEIINKKNIINIDVVHK